MPQEIIDQALMPLFGGYQGYLEAPRGVVERHELVWRAKNAAKAEMDKRIEQKQRDWEMNHGG